MTFARALILVYLALLIYCASSTNMVTHGFVDPSGGDSAVFGEDGTLLSGNVETRTSTFEFTNNGNFVDMTDNIREQWMRFTITNGIDGIVLSDHSKVIQMIEDNYVNGVYHDICTILLSHPASYNPYSDVLIELVVGVGHGKCNVVIVDKGDAPLIVRFDNCVIATTEHVTQDGIYFVENQVPTVYSKWISFNFYK